jgi:hypothetical protein
MIVKKKVYYSITVTEEEAEFIARALAGELKRIKDLIKTYENDQNRYEEVQEMYYYESHLQKLRKELDQALDISNHEQSAEKLRVYEKIDQHLNL